MRMQPHHGGWFILVSIIVALMLTMLPLPHWAVHLRPEWLSMLVVYWCLHLPERFGVGYAWIAGLFLDIVNGAVLGQYAMALSLIAYFTLSLHQRLRVYPPIQQAIIVMLLLMFQQLVVVWIRGFMGQSADSLYYWLPPITSMLIWPWLALFVRELQRKYRVR